jgi:hypothetical protein
MLRGKAFKVFDLCFVFNVLLYLLTDIKIERRMGCWLFDRLLLFTTQKTSEQ